MIWPSMTAIMAENGSDQKVLDLLLGLVIDITIKLGVLDTIILYVDFPILKYFSRHAQIVGICYFLRMS